MLDSLRRSRKVTFDCWKVCCVLGSPAPTSASGSRCTLAMSWIETPELAEVVGRRGLQLVGEHARWCDAAWPPPAPVARAASERTAQRARGSRRAEPCLDADADRRRSNRDFGVDTPQPAPRCCRLSCASSMGCCSAMRCTSDSVPDHRTTNERLSERHVAFDLGQQHGLARAARADDDGVELVPPRPSTETGQHGVKDLLATDQQRRRNAEPGVERIVWILLDTSAPTQPSRRSHVRPPCIHTTHPTKRV